MHLSEPPPTASASAAAVAPPPATTAETCRFPKLEECAHFHYERVQLPQLEVVLKEDMEVSLHSHASPVEATRYYTLQVTSRDECWLIQRTLENFAMLDSQLHQCIYDRKISMLPDLNELLHKQQQDTRKEDEIEEDDNNKSNEQQRDFEFDLEELLSNYLNRLFSLTPMLLNCGPILNWFQLDNRGHRLLVPSEESRSINTPAVAAAYSVRRYVAQARDELSLEVGDMISVIDMASPGESVWWRGKRGFQVGFFPQWCVCIIGEKVPRNVPVPPPVVGSLAISPIKPVLRKHGKLITFFRSFILNRPSRRRLKQSGILKERVFGCDLGEHLLNSGHEIPMVLKCCAKFIESHGIVDGIYRLSGVTSNIQKLRNAFDEDRIPNLYTDDILQDIHSVASLLKMYFRELPNPLCTYQLYQSFVQAVQGCSASRNKASDNERLLKMREAVQKLPPPHYRTLEYLMRHLALISTHGHNTGMTTRNLAIVWAPNLLRCEELEVGGVAALQGVGVQAVVTEFFICYADLIFSDQPQPQILLNSQDPQEEEKKSRPKSLAISTPTKLLTLEEARNKHLLMKDEGSYIEVGGGPKSLPKKYHTVIELPPGRKRLSKRSPSGWRSFFSKSRNSSHGNLATKNRDISSPGIIPIDKSVTESDLNEIKRKLRPVKSAESLISGQSEPANCDGDVLGPLHSLTKPPGHNRSVSHDSYFDNLQNSTNNSVGSLLDLSEIQLNFELEESEMRIFSEDESLVSSPKVQKDVMRKSLNRARPEDFSSTTNSSNPSPKKQPRVILSPDSLSRKRSRLEDQLSDIQYIDCNTPENAPCLISTTAMVHHEDSATKIFEGYQPKNKSPRNSDGSNRHSLNFEKCDKVVLPKSLTDVDFKKSLTPTPDTPNYKPLHESSCTNTPVLTPTSSPKPTYENVLTTISITYKSPTKSRNSDNIYEDIELNPEKAVVPTTVASLPIQEASQPKLLETNFDESITTILKDKPSLEFSDSKKSLITPTQSSTSSTATEEESTPTPTAEEPENRRNQVLDKRKSCEAELLDENAIYQQVKYFRRSIHEINSLLDICDEKSDGNDEKLVEVEKNEPEENFDSLEADNVHVYENLDTTNRNLDDCRSRMHEAEPKKVDLAAEVVQELPVCSKCSPETEKPVNCSTNTKEENESQMVGKIKMVYDKDGLPPCLRAKNAKNSIKTRSLDENAFVTEFGRTNLQRRKSLDDRTSSYINSKLDSPKSSSSTTDIHFESRKSTKTIELSDQKLNRERIEKYKEERRNFWREKYRSESFKEDKDKLLLRIKQKNKLKNEENEEKRNQSKTDEMNNRLVSTKDELDAPVNRLRTSSCRFSHRLKDSTDEENSLNRLPQRFKDLDLELTANRNNRTIKTKEEASRNEISVSNRLRELESGTNDDKSVKLKELENCSAAKKLPVEALSKFEKDAGVKLLRRKNSPSLERKCRPSLKELSDKLLEETAIEEAFLERPKRLSHDSKTPRKEKSSPSYCIKDMKAIFEPKSQQ